MAEKRRLRRTMKELQRVKTWQLVIMLILAGFIAATFLRLNNIGMIERRAAVLSADKSGDEQNITNRLYDLQRYVSAHMNTNMGNGIYLQNQYNRASQAIVDAASAQATPKGNVYKEINDACKAIYHSYTPYFQCVTDRLSKAPGVADPVTNVNLPKADIYKYNFSSPFWSPDFAGWSTLVCVVIGLMIIARLISVGVLRLILRHHYKSV